MEKISSESTHCCDDPSNDGHGGYMGIPIHVYVCLWDVLLLFFHFNSIDKKKLNLFIHSLRIYAKPFSSANLTSFIGILANVCHSIFWKSQSIFNYKYLCLLLPPIFVTTIRWLCFIYCFWKFMFVTISF